MPGRSAFPCPKGALTHHPKGAVVLAVGKPCALRGGFRFLRKATDNAIAPAGAAVIVCAIGEILSLQPTLFLQPPAQTCHWQLCRRDGRAFCPSIFSFAKEKQKKENEVNEQWQFIIWKRRWSAGAQDAPQWPPPLIIRHSCCVNSCSSPRNQPICAIQNKIGIRTQRLDASVRALLRPRFFSAATTITGIPSSLSATLQSF